MKYIANCLSFSLFLACLLTASVGFCETWPELPRENAQLSIPAQEWKHQPGPREVEIQIYYPKKSFAKVGPETGLMLSLHNWGGTFAVGTANPQVLADRLNVVAICVNYLQSGRQASVEDPEPYDFGYLQALDALRALYFVFDGLKQQGCAFHSGRIYATGGSGGGNVTLMANKLAPRTFTCIIDMCGMAKLSDDIAFGLPGGSRLSARWSQDLNNPFYLSTDEQELRFVGNPKHLAAMKAMGHACKIFVVHGAGDDVCPIADAREMITNMQQAELDVVPFIVEKKDLDGKVFTSIGHALGDRTEIVFKVTGNLLMPGHPDAVIRDGRTDFERRDSEVRYQTSNGQFVISYENGYPVGKFLAL